MSPHASYRTATAASWTRIDMLIALYHEAEVALLAARTALDEDSFTEYGQHYARTIKLLIAILEGIDVERDETSRNIHSLCLFMIRTLATPEPDIESVLKILTTLKASFEAIRDEANHLEQSGQIPKLSTATQQPLVAIG